MTKPLILVTDGSVKGTPTESGSYIDNLRSHADLIVLDSPNRAAFLADLSTKYAKVVAILYTFRCLQSIGPFDAEIAEALRRDTEVRAIVSLGAGYDHINDIDAFTKAGIRIANVVAAGDAATADTALFLLLGAMRNFGQPSREIRQGVWRDAVSLEYPVDPSAAVLGIVGMGGIGQALRDRVAPLGFKKIVYYNRSRLSPEKEKGAEYVSFEELLAVSDVISVHVPLNSKTHHLFDAEALAKTKPGVIIVNTARGAVIDEAALVAALESGHVRNVGLDVFEEEPKIHPGLLTHPRTVLLPHIGAFTKENLWRMEDNVVDCLVSEVTQGKLPVVIKEQQDVLGLERRD